MPIYEYQCKSCLNEFEELVFSADELAICPKCQSAKTQKVLSKPCLCHCAGGDSSADFASAASSGSACSGCSGGSCGSCKS